MSFMVTYFVLLMTLNKYKHTAPTCNCYVHFIIFKGVVATDFVGLIYGFMDRSAQKRNLYYNFKICMLLLCFFAAILKFGRV